MSRLRLDTPDRQFSGDRPGLASFIRQVHANGSCLTCARLLSTEIDWGKRGLYYYSAHHTFYIAEPYGRYVVPETPLHVRDLRPEFQALAPQRQLPLSFEQTRYIQPIEHMPCRSWTAGYLTEDGATIRAVPGREAEFLDDIAELERAAAPRGIRIEPPE